MRKREEAEQGAAGGGHSLCQGPGQDAAGCEGDSEEALRLGQSVRAGWHRPRRALGAISMTGFYQEGKAGPGGL